VFNKAELADPSCNAKYFALFIIQNFNSLFSFYFCVVIDYFIQIE
jgi:hypothetical protein